MEGGHLGSRIPGQLARLDSPLLPQNQEKQQTRKSPQTSFACKLEKWNGLNLGMIEEWRAQVSLLTLQFFKAVMLFQDILHRDWHVAIQPPTPNRACSRAGHLQNQVLHGKGNKSCSPFLCLPDRSSTGSYSTALPGIYFIFLFPTSLYIVQSKIFYCVGICKTFQKNTWTF